MAGSTAICHIAIAINATHQMQQLIDLCNLPDTLYNDNRAPPQVRSLAKDLRLRCDKMMAEIRERELLFDNPYNDLISKSTRKRKRVDQPVVPRHTTTEKYREAWTMAPPELKKPKSGVYTTENDPENERESRQEQFRIDPTSNPETIPEPEPLIQMKGYPYSVVIPADTPSGTHIKVRPVNERKSESKKGRKDQPMSHKRTRRQIFAGIMAVIGLVGAVSLVYSSSQLEDVTSSAQSGQAINVKLLQSHENRLSLSEHSIEILNTTISEVLLMNGFIVKRQEYFEAVFHIGYCMDVVERDLNRILLGMDALAEHRITAEMLNINATSHTLIELRNSMAIEGYTLALERVDDLFRCVTSSLVYKNGSIWAIIHVPAFKIDTRMKLLEFVPMPYDIETDDDTKLGLTAYPTHNILAVSGDEETFRVMHKSELDVCQKMTNIYFCANSNIADRRTESSCLYGLYKGHIETINKHCKWRANKQADFAIQLTPTSFLLYSSLKDEIRLQCQKPTHETVSALIEGLVEVTVPTHCTLKTRSYVLDGQANFATQLDTFEAKPMNYSSVFQHSGFSEAVLAHAFHRLALVGSSEGVTIENIADRYAQTQFTSHMTWGTRVALGILITLLMLVGCYLAYKCYSLRGKQGGIGNSFNFNLPLGASAGNTGTAHYHRAAKTETTSIAATEDEAAAMSRDIDAINSSLENQH